MSGPLADDIAQQRLGVIRRAANYFLCMGPAAWVLSTGTGHGHPKAHIRLPAACRHPPGTRPPFSYIVGSGGSPTLSMPAPVRNFEALTLSLGRTVGLKLCGVGADLRR